jgi:hypothetical protein
MQSSLEQQVSIEVLESEIKALMCRTAESMIGVGIRLNLVKQKLPYGHWSTWLKTKFGLSERSAHYYMRAAALYPDYAELKDFNVSLRILRMLSSGPRSALISGAVRGLIEEGKAIDDTTANSIIESSNQIQVGTTIEITGDHALKGKEVTVIEVEDALTTIEYKGVQMTLLPREIGLIDRKPASVKQNTKSDYTQLLQSQNALITEELEEVRSLLRELMSHCRKMGFIPVELVERVSHVI